jgi:hypothetical protein
VALVNAQGLMEFVRLFVTWLVCKVHIYLAKDVCLRTYWALHTVFAYFLCHFFYLILISNATSLSTINIFTAPQVREVKVENNFKRAKAFCMTAALPNERKLSGHIIFSSAPGS